MMRVLRWLGYGSIDFLGIMLYPLWRWLGKERIRILAYHSVRDIPRGVKFSFNVTPIAFAQQMEYLASNKNNVITFDDLVDCKEKGHTLPSKPVIITFDDGYADNYVNAFPILKQHNFKATIFLVTDFINSVSIFNWLKLDEPLRLHQQDEKASWLPLDRQSILEMQAYGISFGAHTRTHRKLDEIEEHQAIDEIVNSKKRLEEILSEPVICFSYPFNRMNEKIKGLVKEAGYKIAVADEGAVNLKSDFFKLKRIGIERGDSLNKFARKINGAYEWIEYPFSVYLHMKRILSQIRGNNQ